MVIFHSYVKLPEGKHQRDKGLREDLTKKRDNLGWLKHVEAPRYAVWWKGVSRFLIFLQIPSDSLKRLKPSDPNEFESSILLISSSYLSSILYILIFLYNI